VTAQGVVCGVLSELGAHGGRGGVLGGCGVAGSSHCEVGASEGVCRDGIHPLGVGVGVGGRKQKGRERVLAGQQPRAPPLPRVQLKNNKKFFPRSTRLQRGRGSADLLPFPWSACKRRKKGERGE
jgi:hypothetical protein